jgi:hypothetical protein
MLGRGRQWTVHRLVLEAFVGPCPDGHQCGHDNGVPSDNRVANLAWVTPRVNTLDKHRHGTMPMGDRHPARVHPERLARGDRTGSRLYPERYPHGEDYSTAKLTNELVIAIRAEWAGGATQTALAAKYGVGRSTIGRVVRRVHWKHVQ